MIFLLTRGPIILNEIFDKEVKEYIAYFNILVQINIFIFIEETAVHRRQSEK